jgi:acetylornithine deacetylase/succinyl-diaminopimelate desuccinylase-like protein
MPQQDSGNSAAGHGPVELLQNLIRFDTTNPPGDEAKCVDYIKTVLEGAGFETFLAGKVPNRTNLVTRLKGNGEAPPLMMYGHLDVVTTANQKWSVDPFEGVLAGDYVWGRGALDMKGGVAMMLAALLRAKSEGMKAAGDIVFVALSDEEAGGEYGAKFLAERHPEHFQGIRYAIGEFGGFPLYFGGKKFYAIQVTEKQICWLKATVKGPGGHGALPKRGGTMARLAEFLKRLNENRLPVHIDPVVRQMLETVAAEATPPANEEFARLLDPKTTDSTLDNMGESGLMLDAMLHNTVNPNIIRGGGKINVIPSEVALEVDGRLLPGFTPENMIAELRDIIGDLAEFELISHDKGPPAADMGLFETLAEVIQDADPEGMAVPLLQVGCTDARFFAELGIQSYGFLPMNLPADFDFLHTVHAADERIPVDSLLFGTDAVYDLIRRYGT